VRANKSREIAGMKAVHVVATRGQYARSRQADEESASEDGSEEVWEPDEVRRRRTEKNS